MGPHSAEQRIIATLNLRTLGDEFPPRPAPHHDATPGAGDWHDIDE